MDGLKSSLLYYSFFVCQNNEVIQVFLIQLFNHSILSWCDTQFFKFGVKKRFCLIFYTLNMILVAYNVFYDRKYCYK